MKNPAYKMKQHFLLKTKRYHFFEIDTADNISRPIFCRSLFSTPTA